MALRPRACSSYPPSSTETMRLWQCLSATSLQLLGHPCIISIHQPDHGHVVFTVCIEAGRDQQQIRLESLQRGQPSGGHRLAKSLAAGARRHRHVDDVFVAAVGADIGIERMLESRAQHHARIIVKDVFGAVAVMHVEIRNRHAAQAMRGQCMRCADRDIVEDAEPHRPRPFGMVAGRAHVAEGILHLARHHQIHAQHCRTRSTQCRRISKRIHCRCRRRAPPCLVAARRLRWRQRSWHRAHAAIVRVSLRGHRDAAGNCTGPMRSTDPRWHECAPDIPDDVRPCHA